METLPGYPRTTFAQFLSGLIAVAELYQAYTNDTHPPQDLNDIFGTYGSFCSSRDYHLLEVLQEQHSLPWEVVELTYDEYGKTYAKHELFVYGWVFYETDGLTFAAFEEKNHGENSSNKRIMAHILSALRSLQSSPIVDQVDGKDFSMVDELVREGENMGPFFAANKEFFRGEGKSLIPGSSRARRVRILTLVPGTDSIN